MVLAGRRIKLKKSKKIFSFILVIVFLFSSSGIIAAQDLSLKEAVKILVANNRELENARKDIANAEKDVELTVRSYFPTLDLSSSYTKLDEPSMGLNPAYPSGPLFVEGSDDSYTSSLSLTQPLWLGGKVAMQKKIAGYSLEISRADYEAALEDQLFNLIQSYYGVLQAKALVDIQEEALDIVNEHLRIVKNNLEAGVAIRQDLLQSQIEQRNAEEDLTAARNDLQIARRRLSQMLVIKQDYQVNDPQPDLNLNLVQQQLYQTALQNDPDLLKLELNKKIIELNQKLAGQYYRPNISLNGSYDWTGDDFPGDDESWSMTVGVNVPLYDGGEGGINADKQEIQLEQLANTRQNLLENIDIDVEDSILTVNETKESLELEKLSLENAAENLEIANTSYDAGVSSNSDVIDAQGTYNQAKISLMQARYQYEIELFRTVYKTGRLKEFFEDVIADEK